MKQGLLRRARAIYRRTPNGARRNVRRLLVRVGASPPALSDDLHPERIAVLSFVSDGAVLEVGCGPRKTREDFIGVDLTPGGRFGTVGNADGRRSQADVAADGQWLPFAGGSFRSLIARHNLEHYVDLVAVLREWERVLTPGGQLVLVVPDEDAYPGRTVELDPTHYHAFNAQFLGGLFELLGWRIERIEECVPQWSLIAVVETPTE